MEMFRTAAAQLIGLKWQKGFIFRSSYVTNNPDNVQ